MRVTYAAARQNPGMIDQLREDAEWASHQRGLLITGEGVHPDMWAAANTPDDVFAIPGLAPVGWKELKAAYYQLDSEWAELQRYAAQLVRIATGNERIKNLVIRES